MITVIHLIYDTHKYFNLGVVLLKKEYYFFVVSSLFLQGSRFVAEFIAAKRLGTEMYGVWAMISLMIIYVSHSHLGILNAIWRDIPYYNEKSESKKVEQLVSIGAFTVLLLILIFTLVLCIAIKINLNGLGWREALAVLFYFVVFQIYSFSQYMNRSMLVFIDASKQQFFAGLFIFVSLILFYSLQEFWVFVVGLSVSYFIVLNLVKNVNFSMIKLFQKSHGLEMINLIKVGAPIMLIGVLYVLLTSVDRWLVAYYFGVHDLGVYNFSFQVYQGGALFVTMLATYYYPQLSRELGRYNCNYKVYLLLRKQLFMGVVIGCTAFLGIVSITPYVVRAYLAEYLDSIRIAIILSSSLPLIGCSLLISGFFNVINKQQKVLFLMVGVVILNLIFGILFVMLGWGLKGIAYSTLFSLVAYSLGLLGFLKVEIDQFRRNSDGELIN